MIATDARPRLAAKARLRFDRKTSRYLLLYPERGLELKLARRVVPPEKGVGDGLRLLGDLLEHEQVVATLLGG